ncbi:MAG: ankyrin repeat domain-containing protein, partial [Acidobacteria bacterium]|nr:ankyrin repeat domain-containing protein [Acidobacteriota bacterium]
MFRKLFHLRLWLCLLLCLGAALCLTRAHAQEGENPLKLLTEAISKGDVAAAREALAKGADAGHRTSTGNTLLMYAVVKGKAEMVALLIEHGADANVRTADGRTALILAVITGDAELTRLVLRATA